MSFDIKYNRDGEPIKPQQEPEFVEAEVVEAEFVEAAPVVEQLAAPDIVVENQGAIAEEAPEAPIAKPVQQNWKEVRDRIAQAEKRNKELEQALKDAQAKPVQQDLPEEDLSIDLDEDALAEGKHLKKFDKRFQKMQRELDQYKQQAQLAQQQSAQQALQAKLKTQYPDWDQVYNEENIARLQVQEPEIYHALNSSTDVYRAGISAYKMIKQMGLSDPVDVYAQDKARAQANASKPKALASISPQQGDSPLSKANAFANGFTDDLRKQMLKEMNEARRGY